VTRAERLQILGPTAVAKIRARAAEAPPAPAALIEDLRRIFRPAHRSVSPIRPAEVREAA
jgi:hypothetical protein